MYNATSVNNQLMKLVDVALLFSKQTAGAFNPKSHIIGQFALVYRFQDNTGKKTCRKYAKTLDAIACWEIDHHRIAIHKKTISIYRLSY